MLLSMKLLKLRYSTVLFWMLLFCFTAATAQGQQFTVVTGTITDPSGLPYSGASIKAQLVTTAGSPVTGQPTATNFNQAQCVAASFGNAPCQMPIQGTLGPISLDPTGSFTLNIFANGNIAPASTQWLFSITLSPGVAPPLGTGPQSCSASLTISGSSQSVSSSFSCPSVATPGVSSGGGGGPGYVLATVFGVKATSIWLCDATFTNTSFTVTTPATDRPFNASMIGQVSWGSAAGGECGGNSNIPILVVAQGTVTVFNNAHSVNTSQAAAGACAPVNSDGCVFVVGPDDSAGMNAGFQAAAAACGTLVLPAGGIIMQNPPVATNVACPSAVAGNDAGSGMTVYGQGPYSTMLLFSPSTTFGNAVFAIGYTVGGNAVRRSFHDFGVASFSPAPAGAAGATGFNIGGFNNEFYNIWMLDYFSSTTNNFTALAIGSVTNAQTMVHNNLILNAGQVAVKISGDGATFYSNWVQGSNQCIQINGVGVVRMRDNSINLCGTNGAIGFAVAATLYSDRDIISAVGTTLPVIALNGTASAFIAHNLRASGAQTTGPTLACDGAGSVCIIDGDGSGSSISTSTGTANAINNVGKLTLHNVSISSSGGVGLSNSGTVTVKEGNTFGNGITNSGTIQGQQEQGVLFGSCTGTVTASSTLSPFGQGQVTATTCTGASGTIGKVMSKAGTAYGLFVTAGTGGVNASSGAFTVFLNHNGTNTAQALTCTVGTGTSCNDGTAAHAFAYVAGDIITVQFTTQAADTLANLRDTVVTQ